MKSIDSITTTGVVMRISYLTHDEVNQSIAVRLASRARLTITPIMAKDFLGTAFSDILLLDLDHLPGDYKRSLLREVAAGMASSEIVVHSYNLEDDEIDLLHSGGIAVFRDIRQAMIAVRLASTAMQQTGEILSVA